VVILQSMLLGLLVLFIVLLLLFLWFILTEWLDNKLGGDNAPFVGTMITLWIIFSIIAYLQLS